jgi:hypothetical protein
MGLDLRWPIGLMFSIIGALLTIYGLFTRGGDEYQRSLDININLRWGVVLLVFGVFMLMMAIKGAKSSSSNNPPNPQDKK